MRYPKDHKQRSRGHILDVAARLFRQHGYSGVSIDTLMSEAGLTRGGFYGHFKSKADLFNAVLYGDHDFVLRMQRNKGTSKRERGKQNAAVATGYLAPKNRQSVINGCSLAALAMDTTRGEKSTQVTYAKIVRELVDEFRTGLIDDQPLDERALAVIATCVGGLLLSGACEADEELSTAISRACSKRAADLLITAPSNKLSQ